MYEKFRFTKRANELLQPLSTKKHGVHMDKDLKRLSNTLKGAGRTYMDFMKVTGGKFDSSSFAPSLSSLKGTKHDL